MKDLQGKWRGRCRNDCECQSFESSGRQCEYCGHDAQQHKELTKCSCGQCEQYEEDEGSTVHECSYCECSADKHIKCSLPSCTKPCYFENGRLFDYCGRTHAKEHLQGHGGGENLCRYPGCLRTKYQEGSRLHDFCGRTHATLFVQEQQRGFGRSFQNPQTPTPISVPLNFSKSRAVVSRATGKEEGSEKTRFMQLWDQSKGSPGTVKAVFTITNPDVKQRFEQYTSTLRQANVGTFYHGTVLKCNVAETGRLCQNSACGVCGISHIGFAPQKLGTHIQWFLRFGKAFYFATNSSKCHEYTEGYSRYRALMCCDVAQGSSCMAKDNMKDVTQPPGGFDSITGKKGVHRPGQRGSLNFDEVAVFRPDAILPKYIIFYERDGIALIAKPQ